MSKTPDTDGGQSSQLSRPDLTTQMKFTDDGGLEEDDTPTETSLGDWGMDVDDDDGDTRIETGASDEFVDDRTVIPGQGPDDGEQEALVVGRTDEAQQSLSGDSGTEYCPFEDEQNGSEASDGTDSLEDRSSTADEESGR